MHSCSAASLHTLIFETVPAYIFFAKQKLEHDNHQKFTNNDSLYCLITTMRTFSRLKNRSKRYFGDHQNQDLSSKKLPNLVEEPETSRETARSSDDFEVELNPNENLFLTYVARGNLLEAERIMQLGVDVNVKNSFHRYFEDLRYRWHT